MKKYFRRQPPAELVVKAIQSLGFDSMLDTKWIEEDYLVPDQMLQVLEEVAPYYIPCWRRTFLEKEEFGYSDYVCIVRQLLRTQDGSFVRKDKMKRLEKNVVRYVPQYRLKNPGLQPFSVGFD